MDNELMKILKDTVQAYQNTNNELREKNTALGDGLEFYKRRCRIGTDYNKYLMEMLKSNGIEFKSQTEFVVEVL